MRRAKEFHGSLRLLRTITELVDALLTKYGIPSLSLSLSLRPGSSASLGFALTPFVLSTHGSLLSVSPLSWPSLSSVVFSLSLTLSLPRLFGSLGILASSLLLFLWFFRSFVYLPVSFLSLSLSLPLCVSVCDPHIALSATHSWYSVSLKKFVYCPYCSDPKDPHIFSMASLQALVARGIILLLGRERREGKRERERESETGVRGERERERGGKTVSTRTHTPHSLRSFSSSFPSF